MTDQQAKRFTLALLECISLKYGMEHRDWRFRHRRQGVPEQFHYPEVSIDRLPPRYVETWATRVLNPNYYGRVIITP